MDPTPIASLKLGCSFPTLKENLQSDGCWDNLWLLPTSYPVACPHWGFSVPSIHTCCNGNIASQLLGSILPGQPGLFTSTSHNNTHNVVICPTTKLNLSWHGMFSFAYPLAFFLYFSRLSVQRKLLSEGTAAAQTSCSILKL